METTLAASSRSAAQGKGGARKARKSGLLPGVVYGAGQAANPVSVDPTALVDIFRKSQNRNTILQLSLDGKNIPVLVREVQRHPVSREILHVDFYHVQEDRPVRIEVPLVAVGKAKGLSAGGRLEVVRRSLVVLARHDSIPATIEVDVTELDVGDILRVSKVVPPSGVKIVFEADFPVAAVTGRVRAEGAEDKK